jgi:hypothetical protein
MSVPEVAFLGLCESDETFRTEKSDGWIHNVVALSPAILSPIFPLSLQGYSVVFAVYNIQRLKKARLRFLGGDGIELFGFDLDSDVEIIRDTVIQGSPLFNDWPGWVVCIGRIPNLVFIKSPCNLRVVMSRDGVDIPTGQLVLKLDEVLPLSPERIKYLKLNPDTAGWVTLAYQCSTCKKQLKVYAGIDRNELMEKDGRVWYRDLPDSFICDCGAINFDLGVIRANMHGLLGHAVRPDGTQSFTRYYENTTLDVTRLAFQMLLMFDDITEEQVQKFIEEHPVLLSLFSPVRIFYKAPILSKYKTDIVILTPKKELLLIELEKPTKPLLKKDGGISAELQHPFDQVRDWLHEADEHRAAILSCIGLTIAEVGAIRGVVIMGRDKGYDPEHLRKLKSTDFGRITLFTYDDLIMSLSSIARSVKGF